MLAPEARPGPLHFLGAQRRDLHLSLVARWRARLHLGKRHHTVDAPVPCTSLASACSGKGGGHLVLASAHGTVAALGKAATATHGSQRDDRVEHGWRALGAEIVPRTTPGPPGHALAAVSPAAPLPSGHPTPGTPIF